MYVISRKYTGGLKMAKTVAINFREFMRNDWRKPRPLRNSAKLATSISIVMIPRTVFAAASDATFQNVWGAVMNIVDWLAVGVFIFAGVSWMFGHRGKALEFMIGGSAGYILARHAIDIRDFLKTI
jgi:hypothetical protein